MRGLATLLLLLITSAATMEIQHAARSLEAYHLEQVVKGSLHLKNVV